MQRISIAANRRALHKRYNKNCFSKKSDHEQVALIEGEVLFGLFPVLMALKANRRRFHAVYHLNNPSERVVGALRLAAALGVPVRATDRGSLDALSTSDKGKGKNSHQGLCADVDRLRQRDYGEDKKEVSDTAQRRLWVLLCGLKDPMNLGAVLRSAYFLGAERVLTTPEYPCSGLTPVVSKASAGVMEIFPPSGILRTTTEDFLKDRTETGWKILGTGVKDVDDEEEATLTSSNGDDVHHKQKALLILGSEGFGLPTELAALCHRQIHIKPGRTLDKDVDSLNVSVAAAIAMYKVMKL